MRVVRLVRKKTRRKYLNQRILHHVNVYDDQDRWVGFFIDEQTARTWLRKHPNFTMEDADLRDVPCVPAPVPVKKVVKPKKRVK